MSKAHDGSDSIDGADSTLAVGLNGVVEGDDISVSGSIRYSDSEIGMKKAIIAEDIEISGTDKNNYFLSSTTATANVGTIGKRSYPLNTPQSKIDVANTVKKLLTVWFFLKDGNGKIMLEIL